MRSLTVYWGDGSQSGENITFTMQPYSMSHVYCQPGEFNVEATVETVSPNGVLSAGTGIATIGVIGSTITIAAEAIDQDDPTNKKWGPAPSVVYGGTIPSTADNLRLTVATTKYPSDPPASYSWTVTGRGASNFAPPGNSAVWDLGDLQPTAGILMFTCTATFASGDVSTGNYSIEVGIRTDDIILVGWINRKEVTLPIGTHPWVRRQFPPDGQVVDVPDALLILWQLSQFFENPHFLLRARPRIISVSRDAQRSALPSRSAARRG